RFEPEVVPTTDGSSAPRDCPTRPSACCERSAAIRAGGESPAARCTASASESRTGAAVPAPPEARIRSSVSAARAAAVLARRELASRGRLDATEQDVERGLEVGIRVDCLLHDEAKRMSPDAREDERCNRDPCERGAVQLAELAAPHTLVEHPLQQCLP